MMRKFLEWFGTPARRHVRIRPRKKDAALCRGGAISGARGPACRHQASPTRRNTLIPAPARATSPTANRSWSGEVPKSCHIVLGKFTRAVVSCSAGYFRLLLARGGVPVKKLWLTRAPGGWMSLVARRGVQLSRANNPPGLAACKTLARRNVTGRNEVFTGPTKTPFDTGR